MKKQNLLGMLLSLAVGAALLISMLLRAFLPRVILPKLDALSIIVLSLIALVLDAYLTKEKKRNYWVVPIYSGVIFGLFPWVACFAAPLYALKLAVMGAVIFTVITVLFDSVINRLSTSPASKTAPVISAFGIYLAFQCVMGMFPQ